MSDVNEIDKKSDSPDQEWQRRFDEDNLRIFEVLTDTIKKKFQIKESADLGKVNLTLITTLDMLEQLKEMNQNLANLAEEINESNQRTDEF